jgi:outer membrane protein OmpA-like peptidoglycan-associated protein
MKTIRSIIAITGVIGIGAIGIGCGAAMPPQDLVNARSAYDRASKGPAAQLDPADMHTAKVQLDLAEASFANEGDTQGTRDQSYVAVRKTEFAETIARTAQSTQAKNGVVSGMHAEEKKAVALTSAELGRTNAELGRTRTQLAAQGVTLQNETSRREDAEKRAAQAAADLAKFATVKQEPRGMVITLSGSVLFASAKWDLLPAAQMKLNDVANALTREDPLSKMVVEGHTDSQGSVSYNQDLSQHRAQAVRDYLVTRGIAGDRIAAQGFGPTRSIADNASPEGRANNRRVEIVVLPATAP